MLLGNKTYLLQHIVSKVQHGQISQDMLLCLFESGEGIINMLRENAKKIFIPSFTLNHFDGLCLLKIAKQTVHDNVSFFFKFHKVSYSYFFIRI